MLNYACLELEKSMDFLVNKVYSRPSSLYPQILAEVVWVTKKPGKGSALFSLPLSPLIFTSHKTKGSPVRWIGCSIWNNHGISKVLNNQTNEVNAAVQDKLHTHLELGVDLLPLLPRSSCWHGQTEQKLQLPLGPGELNSDSADWACIRKIHVLGAATSSGWVVCYK